MIAALGLEDLSNLWLNIMTMLLGDKESSVCQFGRCIAGEAMFEVLGNHFCGIDFSWLRNVPDKCVDAAGHAEVLLWQHFERETVGGARGS